MTDMCTKHPRRRAVADVTDGVAYFPVCAVCALAELERDVGAVEPYDQVEADALARRIEVA